MKDSLFAPLISLVLLLVSSPAQAFCDSKNHSLTHIDQGWYIFTYELTSQNWSQCTDPTVLVRLGKSNGNGKGKQLEGEFSLDGASFLPPSNRLGGLEGHNYYDTYVDKQGQTGYVYFYWKNWQTVKRLNGFVTFAHGNGSTYHSARQYHFNIRVSSGVTVLVEGEKADDMGAYPVDLGDLTQDTSRLVRLTITSDAAVNTIFRSANGALMHKSADAWVYYRIRLADIDLTSGEIKQNSPALPLSTTKLNKRDFQLQISTESVAGQNLPSGTYQDELQIWFSQAP